MITGADGQLGKCLFDIVKKNTGTLKNNYYFCSKANVDITSEEDVVGYITTNDIKVVVNCAAFTNVDGCEDGNVGKAFHVNAVAPMKIARILAKSGGMLVHISTDYVYTPYEGWNGEPFEVWRMDPESDKFKNPINVYGMTKFLGETGIVESNCDFCIIRTSWLYSTHGKNFFKTMLKKLQECEDSFKVVSDQIGTPTWAPGLANFIMYEICEKYDSLSEAQKSSVVNYSDEGACSWYDFAKEIQDLTHGLRPFEPTIKPCNSNEYITKAKRPRYSVMCHGILKHIFPGARTEWWKETLKMCVNDYYAENKQSGIVSEK